MKLQDFQELEIVQAIIPAGTLTPDSGIQLGPYIQDIYKRRKVAFIFIPGRGKVYGNRDIKIDLNNSVLVLQEKTSSRNVITTQASAVSTSNFEDMTPVNRVIDWENSNIYEFGSSLASTDVYVIQVYFYKEQ